MNDLVSQKPPSIEVGTSLAGWMPPPLPENLIESVHTDMMINDVFPGLSPHEPTALLLDVNNLFRRASNLGFRIDYGKLKDLLASRCDLRYCGAFSAVDPDDEAAAGWIKYMEDVGYDVITKDIYKYTAENGRHVTKGNMDLEICVAATDLSSAFTHVILGTCDGDFTVVVKRLQRDLVRKVSVLGVSKADGAGMSRMLVKQADNFYNIARIQRQIEFVR